MSTLFVTVSGRVVDLYQPKAEDIYFPDIAEHLAKEARYNGGTPGVFYSVAQHVCLGADAIALSYQGFENLAAYFLCHDFHEYVFKDEVTPKKRALDKVAERFGVLEGAISEAYRELVAKMDAAIHEAAGLTWPPPSHFPQFLDITDKRMLLTEWEQLHGGHKLIGDYSGFRLLPITITPWPWEVAKQELLIRMEQLLPVFEGMRTQPGEVAFG